MDRTKKQHYVSQSILYVFFKVKKIHEYNLKINKDYDSSVENSMCCSDIYECDLYDDNSLEKAFAALYDGEFAKRLKEIDNFLNNNEISKAKEQIKNRKQNEAEAKFSDDIFNAVIENTPLEVPDAMIETELQQMLREVEQNLSQQGLTMDLFQQLTGKTLDDMKAEMREQAEKRVKFNLILSEIVKAENIEVSDDEVDDEIKEIATYYGREFDEVKKLFEGQLGQIRNDLATRKAVQLIKDNVK